MVKIFQYEVSKKSLEVFENSLNFLPPKFGHSGLVNGGQFIYFSVFSLDVNNCC